MKNRNHIPLYGLLILMLQILLNTSCCVMGSCVTDTNDSKQEIYEHQIKEHNPKK